MGALLAWLTGGASNHFAETAKILYRPVLHLETCPHKTLKLQVVGAFSELRIQVVTVLKTYT